MPKAEIDYSNTILYKIVCKDLKIKDLYVGYTTNYVQRKYAHKQNCNNSKSVNYSYKLYEVIRANGGWNNWDMEIIKLFNCKDKFEAKQKEIYYIVLLKPTLNSCDYLPQPIVKSPAIIEPNNGIFLCTICKTHCNSSKHLEEHYTYMHNLKTQTPENADIYICELCDFTCSKNSNYIAHLSTRKHMANAAGDTGDAKNAKHECRVCKNTYTSRNGLWKHSKKCIIEVSDGITNHVFDDSSNEIKILTNIVLEMVKSNNELHKQNTEIQKQHTELQKQMIDVCKNSSMTQHNNINQVNSHNKTFNLQFFLNEECKDAMNISDFANSFELQLADLESVGELGYVEGISKIIVDKLNGMDIYKRPIHCSDAKRETIYVKDENIWTKECRDNPKLRQAIKNVSFRNMKLVYNWSNTYPESKDNQSRLNDKYMKLVIQSTGGSGSILDSENKIIRRIAKVIVIDKI